MRLWLRAQWGGAESWLGLLPEQCCGQEGTWQRDVVMPLA